MQSDIIQIEVKVLTAITTKIRPGVFETGIGTRKNNLLKKRPQERVETGKLCIYIPE